MEPANGRPFSVLFVILGLKVGHIIMIVNLSMSKFSRQQVDDFFFDFFFFVPENRI